MDAMRAMRQSKAVRPGSPFRVKPELAPRPFVFDGESYDSKAERYGAWYPPYVDWCDPPSNEVKSGDYIGELTAHGSPDGSIVVTGERFRKEGDPPTWMGIPLVFVDADKDKEAEP